MPGTSQGLQFYLGVEPQTQTRTVWDSFLFLLSEVFSNALSQTSARCSEELGLCLSGLSDLALVPGEHPAKGSLPLASAVFPSQNCTRLGHENGVYITDFE